MSNQIIEHEETAVNNLPVAPLQDRLLENALAQGASIEQIDKLLDLKIKYDNEQARKAFTAALSEFKAKGIVINKDKKVSFDIKDGTESMSYNHATLGNIIEKSSMQLSDCGLSARWDIKQEDARVFVTCILSHKDGHSESVTLNASPDSSGKKNAIQQVSSTVSYLERYTYLAITGLSTSDSNDDDGVGFEPLISAKNANEIKSLIEKNGTDEKVFLAYAKAENIESIPEKIADKLIKMLIKSGGKNEDT